LKPFVRPLVLFLKNLLFFLLLRRTLEITQDGWIFYFHGDTQDLKELTVGSLLLSLILILSCLASSTGSHGCDKMVVEDKVLAASLLPAGDSGEEQAEGSSAPGCPAGQPVGAPHRRRLFWLLLRGAPPHPRTGIFD
jgi:hypothetical protein